MDGSIGLRVEILFGVPTCEKSPVAGRLLESSEQSANTQNLPKNKKLESKLNSKWNLIVGDTLLRPFESFESFGSVLVILIHFK